MALSEKKEIPETSESQAVPPATETVDAAPVASPPAVTPASNAQDQQADAGATGSKASAPVAEPTGPANASTSATPEVNVDQSYPEEMPTWASYLVPPEDPEKEDLLGFMDPKVRAQLRDDALGGPEKTLGQLISFAGLAIANPQAALQATQNEFIRTENARQTLTKLSQQAYSDRKSQRRNDEYAKKVLAQAASKGQEETFRFLTQMSKQHAALGGEIATMPKRDPVTGEFNQDEVETFIAKMTAESSKLQSDKEERDTVSEGLVELQKSVVEASKGGNTVIQPIIDTWMKGLEFRLGRPMDEGLKKSVLEQVDGWKQVAFLKNREAIARAGRLEADTQRIYTQINVLNEGIATAREKLLDTDIRLGIQGMQEFRLLEGQIGRWGEQLSQQELQIARIGQLYSGAERDELIEPLQRSVDGLKDQLSGLQPQADAMRQHIDANRRLIDGEKFERTFPQAYESVIGSIISQEVGSQGLDPAGAENYVYSMLASLEAPGNYVQKAFMGQFHTLIQNRYPALDYLDVEKLLEAKVEESMAILGMDSTGVQYAIAPQLWPQKAVPAPGAPAATGTPPPTGGTPSSGSSKPAPRPRGGQR